MRTYDFTPLYRSAIGFDRLARLADDALRVDTQPSYPPYDIELVEENAYRIRMVVAGFEQNELDIETERDTLKISGHKATATQGNYLHRGISTQDFERRFQLAEHVKVVSAGLQNGILTVDLIREIPEAMRPRKVLINSGDNVQLLERRAA
ncbi:Hsp20 family protein [Chitinimonas sp. BJYL2]|uniref:Hsp20 family protein n=1 Tax=Chitinimonas sp. BJYL2 TaxID=2976696 RepID=UPI0022B539D2|nr:Hsp20 family protein [Chitinimonas sp. BJYL2]